MLHQQIVVGPLQCNCALVACPETKEAIVIDPGDEGARIVAEVERLGFKVKYLIHTHGHFDHIGGTEVVRSKITAPVCLHRGDEMIYRNLPMQGKMFGFPFGPAPEVEKWLEDNEVIQFGNCKGEVIHTPGHSPGSLCLRVSDGKEELLFSGDTLFQLSIGRSDLWGGDHDQLIRSVRQRLFTLDNDLPVFPGHGPDTRLGDERRNNPFFN